MASKRPTKSLQDPLRGIALTALGYGLFSIQDATVKWLVSTLSEAGGKPPNSADRRFKSKPAEARPRLSSRGYIDALNSELPCHTVQSFQVLWTQDRSQAC